MGHGEGSQTVSGPSQIPPQFSHSAWQRTVQSWLIASQQAPSGPHEHTKMPGQFTPRAPQRATSQVQGGELQFVKVAGPPAVDPAIGISPGP